MAILFSLFENPRVFCAKWIGRVTPSEMLDAYQGFFESNRAEGRDLEFADFSEADLSEIDVPSLKKLCELVASYYRASGIERARCASWVPRDINRSLLQVYEFLSNQSPEETRVFPVKESALNWLLELETEENIELSA